jgi:hypothetical protein
MHRPLILYWKRALQMPMKFTTTKLSELDKQLKQIIKEAEAGKINKAEAAEKILQLREEMDKILDHLRAIR